MIVAYFLASAFDLVQLIILDIDHPTMVEMMIIIIIIIPYNGIKYSGGTGLGSSHVHICPDYD
jgi:uncharacterized membrane protein